jgi:Protein of unknown function (DUF416)
VLTFDEAALTRRLARLARPVPAAFAAACAQRLASGYDRYAAETGAGEPATLAAALASLWDALIEPPPPEELMELADQILDIVPDTLGDWTVSTQYAEDAAAATVYALRCAATGDPGDAVLTAARAYESVDAILLYELDLDFAGAEQEAQLRVHPLTQAELARQERDLDELADAADVRAVVPRLRERALAEPLHPA